MRSRQTDKEASQTRPSVARALSGQAPSSRAARPDPLRLRSGQAFTAQRTLVQDDNQRLLSGAGGGDEEAVGDLLLDVGLFLSVDEIEAAFSGGGSFGQRRGQRAE